MQEKEDIILNIGAAGSAGAAGGTQHQQPEGPSRRDEGLVGVCGYKHKRCLPRGTEVWENMSF